MIFMIVFSCITKAADEISEWTDGLDECLEFFIGSTFGFFCMAVLSAAGREDSIRDFMNWRYADENNDETGND